MPEPLSAVTSIASCIQLVKDLDLMVQGYIDTLKEVPRGARELINELKLISGVFVDFQRQDLSKSLGRLGELVEEGLGRLGAVGRMGQAWRRDLKEKHRGTSLELTGKLVGLVMKLKGFTIGGRDFLERQRKIFSHGKWPFTENEIVSMITRIQDLRNSILSTMELYTRNHTVEAHKIARAHKIAEEERQMVLDWICPDAFDKRHTEVSGKRKGTNQWLFHTPEIINWMENSGILWGYGILGAGKTFVVSSIIDHLQFKGDSGVAYIYFNKMNQKEQTPTIVLRSLLKQLAVQITIIPPELKELYDSLKFRSDLPTIHELYIALIRLSKCFAQTFFVFDALDECVWSQRRELLSLFHRMHSNRISIFVTSRQHSTSIQDSFKYSERLHISATSESIESYIREKIEENPQAKCLIEQGRLEERIISELTDRSRGMFLIVHFEIQYLCKQTTTRQISRALKDLKYSKVKFLDPTYSRAIEELKSQSRDCIELALSTLLWLSKAQRVLSTRELQLAVTVDVEDKASFDECKLPDQMTILDVCAGLVEAKEGAIQLIHYTLQDFLIRKLIITESADLEIATTCIKFLSLGIFAGGACSSDITLKNRLELYPFLEYSAQELVFHLRKCEEDLTVELVLKFIGKPGNISSYLQALYLNNPIDKDLERYNCYPRGLAPLHLVSTIGHCTVVRLLIERGADIMAMDERGWTPLHCAAFEGNRLVVKMLLDHGAMIDSLDEAGQAPLHYAALKGDGSVIRLLLDRGADILGIDKIGRTPLHCLATVWYGPEKHRLQHQLAARLLLKQSTEALLKDKAGKTLLHDTICRIISMDDLRSPRSHCAIDPRKESVAQSQNGGVLDISASNNEKGSLECAVMVFYKPLISLLLDKGININAADFSGKRVLHYVAIGQYCEPLTLFLLEKGAEISALDHNGRTPLHHAVIRGYEPLVVLLIKKGAEILIADNNGQTPLHHATIEGYGSLVLLLLKSGADVLAIDDNGRTPLHYAAAKGSKSLASVLLEHGSDISATDKEGQTPLHYAATGGYQPLVSLLLEKGSNISAVDHKGYTAVNKAAIGGYSLVVQLLLEMRGGFSVECLEKGTVLCLAMAPSNLERYKESLVLFKQVLKIQERRLGTEHLDTADTAQKIIHALSHLGRYEETLGLFKQVLVSQEKNLGKVHVDTLTTTHNMAWVLNRLHRYEAAALLYMEVLMGREKQLGEEHLDTLATAYNMANTLSSLGRYEESVRLNTRILRSRRKILGYEHQGSLDTAQSMAQDLSHLKRYQEALELYTSVLISREKVLGEEHADILAISHNIAWIQYSMGEYEKALKLYRKVLASRGVALEGEYPDSLETTSSMTQNFKSLEEYEDAFELYERVLEVQKKTLGNEHPDILNITKKMTHSLRHVRTYARLLEVYKRALDFQENKLGKEDPRTLKTTQSVKSIYEAAGRFGQVLRFYKDILASREKEQGREHPDTLDAHNKVSSIIKDLFDDEGMLRTIEASSSKDGVIRESQRSEGLPCVQSGRMEGNHQDIIKDAQEMVTTPARSQDIFEDVEEIVTIPARSQDILEDVEEIVTTTAHSSLHTIRHQETFRSSEQTLVIQGELQQEERPKTLEPISKTIPIHKEPRVQNEASIPPRCDDENTVDIFSFLRRQVKRFEDTNWKIKYKISALEFLIIRKLESHKVDRNFPTRVYWKCSCGLKMFDDFQEFNSDRPASQYISGLNQTSRDLSGAGSMFCLPNFLSFPTQAALGGYYQLGVSPLVRTIMGGLELPEFLFFLIQMTWRGGNSHIGAHTGLTNPGGQVSHPPKSTQGGASNPALPPPIHLTQVGSSSHHPQKGGASNLYLPAVQLPNAIRNSPSPAQLISTPDSIDHLLLCFNDGSVNFQNFQLASSTCDQQIFMEIREEYYKQRGWWRSQFSFEVLKRVEFVKFEVYYQNLVEIRARCELPPTSNTEYKYLPKPAEMIPPVPGFMYFFHKPECAPTSDELLTKMPKRVSALRDLGCGWGIHFIEEPCMFRIYMLAVFIVIVDSIFAVVWSVVKKDIQGGFGVAAFITSVGAIFIAIGWRRVSN